MKKTMPIILLICSIVYPLKTVGQWQSLGFCKVEKPTSIFAEDSNIVVTGWHSQAAVLINNKWSTIEKSSPEERVDSILYKSFFVNDIIPVSYTKKQEGRIYLCAFDADELFGEDTIVLDSSESDEDRVGSRREWIELDRLKDKFYTNDDCCGVPLKLYLSTDSGESWSVQSNLILGLRFNRRWTHVQEVARGYIRFMRLSDSSLLISVSGIGIFRSFDEGKSWNRYEEGFGDVLPRFVDFVVAANSIYGVDISGVVWKNEPRLEGK